MDEPDERGIERGIEAALHAMIREILSKRLVLPQAGDNAEALLAQGRFLRATLVAGQRLGEPRCSRCSTTLSVAFPVVGCDCTVCGAPALSMLVRMPMPPDKRLDA